MSRSSSGLSTPGDMEHDSRWNDQPYFEAGKRRISITSRYGPEEDEDVAGSTSSSSSKSKRARHVVFTDVVVETVPPFYILREDSSSPAPLPSSSSHDVRERHPDLWGHPADAPLQDGYAKFLYHDPAAPKTKASAHAEHKINGASQASSVATSRAQSYDDLLMTDEEAADSVEIHVAENRRRNRHSKHERILKSLIRPKSRKVDFEIDNDALQGMLYAANEIFFCGRLKGRVTWEWSDKCNSKFQTNIIGTTALRKASDDKGYETLIILSSHFLRDKSYNRRLLISTFLHELIHSYLFICCGFSARASGGHTDGFVRIANLIDNWAGPNTLHLKNIEADLNVFLDESATYLHDQPLQNSYCSSNISGGSSSSLCHPAGEADYLRRADEGRRHGRHHRASAAECSFPRAESGTARHNKVLEAENVIHPFIVLPSRRPEPIWHYDGPVDYRHNRFA